MIRKDLVAEYWGRISALEKCLKKKACIASDQGGCNGPIISAHTIPRSQLSKLATTGHVTAFKFREGTIDVEEKGIREFSALNCFCRDHDSSIFAPVENAPLIFSSEQLALLHYRAVGAEMYKKQGQVESFRSHVEHYGRNKKWADKKAFFEEQLRFGEIGLRDLEVSFAQVSADLESQSYLNLSALVLEFEKQPSIMTVGAFAPAWDYNSNRLQSIEDLDVILQDVSLSILQIEASARVALVWRKSSEIGRQFATSLLDQPKELVSTLLIKTSFHLIENTCANNGWWGELKNAQQHVLKRWMEPESQTKSMYRFSGVSFDDWVLSNHTFVNS